jgi:hypothetical protein
MKLYGTVALLAVNAMAAELIVTEPEKTCSLEEVGAAKCLLQLKATGATYLGVKGRVAEGPAAAKLTTNELAVPDGGTAVLTVKVADGTFSGAGPHVVTVLIDSRIGKTAQTPKRAQLTIQGTDSPFTVFNGRPVTLLFTRQWLREPETGISFVLRSAETARKPRFVSSEFYRTVGEENYILDGLVKDASIDGDAKALPFSATVRLPRGNYNSAAGSLIFQTANGKDFVVQLLCRIKDDWPLPVAALIAGHLFILLVRRWSQVERPAKVLLLRMLTVLEAVRAFELANPTPADNDKLRLRQIKTLIASARRNLELRKLDQASRQVEQADNLLHAMEGLPGLAPATTQESGALPREQSAGIRGLVGQIRLADLLVELAALTISLLLGAAMYFEADRFGTYSDYLKLFLFAFGISTTTQGFSSVLAQFKGAAPEEAEG